VLIGGRASALQPRNAISQLFTGMAVRQLVNFIYSEKAQWQRKGSVNIPRAPAVTSKARCVATNGALRKVAEVEKAVKLGAESRP
jgi:hypothetical protein